MNKKIRYGKVYITNSHAKFSCKIIKSQYEKNVKQLFFISSHGMINVYNTTGCILINRVPYSKTNIINHVKFRALGDENKIT